MNPPANTASNSCPKISGYAIVEELYLGSRTAVYRAIQTAQQRPVVIKVLRRDYPSFSELLQFRNQYTIAKNLNSPLIIQTYSLEPFQNGYALVMEDFGGISLKEYFAAREALNVTSLQEFLEIAIALCNALDILCRERIIHKDIKPSNILINPETKQVKLIDFSIASLLSRETQTLIHPNVLEGTIAYISPEQTGRMNRGIDYRTDFYSVGVTFYQLLTGKLPFQSEDAMELVHCHLAKTATLVDEINSAIPSVLSEIVSKLMAKNSEDRYQSALGLKYDLENCLIQLKETGRIENFSIAQRDLCDRFIIPDRLYGRKTEVEILLQAFERVSLGATEMMLVAGFSGIGKTAVVNEVHKPIVRQRGYFIKGKYDQFNRNIPFSAFVQVFRDLMGQLLSESDTELHIWKTQILQALGDNGQVIIEVIPELERIIGQQPPAIELSGTAAQNRFNLLFQKFIQVFTTKEHPLVIFLDDLQWADSASLNLMQLLMNELESHYLLMIGAYRDNEVSPAHPLMLTLDAIAKANATINTITLHPLSQGSLNKLVTDTLKCHILSAPALTELIAVKTKGNPFFVTQFLKALYEDELIQFDRNLGHWQCDLAEIRTVAMSDDVVEFMASQLQKLPSDTQDILKLAACIGAQFDLNTLAIVSQQSESDAAVALWKALQEGLIIPQSEIYKFYMGELDTTQNTQTETLNYKFLHDRVQQAAYSLIPDDQKQLTHLKIGQLLLNNTSVTEPNENLFEIVNQLNYGTSLITQQTKREELAQLNLIACRKARAATAYQAAREYVAVGLSLLGKNAWQQHYEMTLDLHELASEVAFLCGDFEEMEHFIDIVIEQAQSLPEQVNVYLIKIQFSVNQSKFTEAIAIAQSLLQQLGVNFPETPTPNDIQQKIQAIKELIGDRKIEDLVHLPVMNDREKLAIVQIASSIISPAHITGSPLLPLLVSLSVKLSIEDGNTSVSAFHYVMYGIILCNMLKDVDTAVEFGHLALQVVLKLDAKAIKSDVLAALGGFLLHRKFHIKETLLLSQEGYVNGLEVGNLEFVGNNAINFCINSFWCGQPLATLEQDVRTYSHGLMQLHQLTAANRCLIVWQSVLNLLDFRESPWILSGEALQETKFLPILLSANDLFGLYFFYLYKLTLCFWFGEIEQGANYAVEVRRYAIAGAGFVGEPAFYFYDSLIVLAQLSQHSDETSEAFQHVGQNQTELRNWAHFAPMNHQHKVDLVEAEKCRVLGKNYEAGDWYDRSISLAKANGYIQEEALANELTAKFYLDWGKEKVAAVYMQEAYYCYAHWGAKAKVTDLEKHYPQLLAPILNQTRSSLSTQETIFALESIPSTSTDSSSSSNVSVALDLATILKASQSISGEIELEKLLSTLLSIVVENAGANKCVLMLLKDDRLLIKGSITLGTEPVLLQRLPIEESQDIPLKLIYKVKHNRQTAVIVDASAELTLANDPYIMRQQPKSVLCSPILRQGKFMGILYLENNLVTGAFTSDRIELLNLLCTQAAISIENAQLYERSQHYAQQLERSLDRLSAEQSRLQASQQRLQLLVEQTPVAVIEWDINFLATDWNPAAERIFGYTKQEALGRHFTFIVPEVIQAQLEGVSVDIISQQGGNYSINENFTKDGKTIICVWHNNALMNADGELIGVASLADDITDRKEAELALEQKSLALENALNSLQQAQIQIVQSEKMSALGNLVAGVAHEINNPVGCIIGNVGAVQDSINDLFGLIDLYNDKFPQPGTEIEEELETIDLEYLRSDLPKLIRAMKDGGDRITSISKSLRTFSRADSDQRQKFNLHEGIDSTILILRHRLKANSQRPEIEIITDYGKLPAIACFPGQLNQVFMNILANAIDALDESNNGRSFADIQAHPNCITIQTSIENETVKIMISDNGKGMSESVKQKIFDHLFTTKAVGKGTGLGLAIARQIVVEKHNGSLEVQSKLGQGTEFCIWLPIHAE